VCERPGEWPGRPRELYERLPGPKALGAPAQIPGWLERALLAGGGVA
jgi:hypothetical protein